MKLRINYEPPIPPEELASEMEAAAQPSVGYYLMLGLSAALATFGLISDSAAVIIGAMIIAPLMNPIIACAYSFARGRKDMWMISTFTIVTGIVLVLLVSSAITITVNYQLKGQEILSRGNPSLIDLGIAVVSGIAGAVAWSRRKIGNALPGVAISIALVPPLCVAGIGLTLGEAAPFDPSRTHHYEVYNIELGAMLLFLTNFAAILICGNLVFLIQGYGRWQGAKLGLISSLVLVSLPGLLEDGASLISGCLVTPWPPQWL